jgi:hypothetical protein
MPNRPTPTGSLNLMTSSSAPDLSALFHAGSALGVLPSKLCSSRVAVRCLQRRCPPVVETSLRPARVAGGRRNRRSGAPNHQRPIWACRRSAPRLQGFAPHESPPPRPGGLGRTEVRGSLGLHPLQGVPSHRNGTAFTAPPLMRFPVWAQAAAWDLYRVLLTDEVGWSLSRLPTLLGFRHLMAVRGSSIQTRSGSRLLKLRGALPSPASCLWTVSSSA